MVNTFEPVTIPEALPADNPLDLALQGLMVSEENIGATIEWNGETYPCTGGPEFGGKMIDEGGFRLNAKVRITVRCEIFNDLNSLPQEKQTILYTRSPNSSAKRYRIDAITNFADAYLELNCNDPAQGA